MLVVIIPTCAGIYFPKEVGSWCVWVCVWRLGGGAPITCLVPWFPLLRVYLIFHSVSFAAFSCVCLCHLSSLSLCARTHKIFISRVYFLFSVLIFLLSWIVNKLCWLQMFPIWQHLRLRFSIHVTGVLAPSSGHPEVCQKQGLKLLSQPSLGSQSWRSVEQKRNRNWAVILGVLMNGLCCSSLFEVTGWRRGGLGSVKVPWALCPISAAAKSSWMGNRCWPRLLPTSLAWLGPYTDSNIQECVTPLALRVTALTPIRSGDGVKRISVLYQVKLPWYLLQKGPVCCDGAICEITLNSTAPWNGVEV